MNVTTVLYTPPPVPADSSGLRQTPVDSGGLQSVTYLSPICHIFVTSWILWTLLDSSGLQWTPVDSGGLRWTPVDSGGLQQTPADSSGIHRTPPDSTGLWGNRKVNKQKKVEVRELNQTPPRNLQSQNHEQLTPAPKVQIFLFKFYCIYYPTYPT